MKFTLGNLKTGIEALLFATQGLNIEQLCSKTGSVKNKVLKALEELRKDYESRDSAFIITCDAGVWKLTVHSHHVSLVKDLIPSEFPKSILETLAVIAYRKPVLQSEVVKIRGNKAYDHIKGLEKLEFIRLKKKGRTNEISLCDKFYDYFNTTPREVKESFNA